MENLAGTNNHSSSLKFVDVHLHLSPELPPDYHSTKNLPPHLMPLLTTAADEVKNNFFDIHRELKPVLVIYDVFQPCAPAVASEE